MEKKILVDIGKTNLAYATTLDLQIDELVLVPVMSFGYGGGYDITVGKVVSLEASYEGHCRSVLKRVADLVVGDTL